MQETKDLAKFLADLSFTRIPSSVLARAEDLCLDWLASVLASQGLRPIPLFEQYAALMGPSSGTAAILTTQTSSSPYFAALVNGAAGHLVEQDDLHNSSVLHPAAVVFPAALAAAQDKGCSGQEFLVAVVAGYEAGIRIAEFLGRSHYKIFHTTATVGTLAAAVAVGKLLKFNAEQFLHVLGNAGTQAAGLWEFLRDAADSKQLHTAKAAADGLLAAYLTEQGLTAAQNILQGEQGMAAGMSSDADARYLNNRLFERWALNETSFKFHASCRHTHPAADALLDVMQRHQLPYEQIEKITCFVHQAAIDVLGRVDEPQTVHQAKFSMGTVLGLIAVHGKAGLPEFAELALTDPNVSAIRQSVSMQLCPSIDAAYPKQWMGHVQITTRDYGVLIGKVTYPKGDPENTLSRAELEDKFTRLMAFSQARPEHERQRLTQLIWQLQQQADLSQLI
ncbi:MAG: MmgE/PrpD family protein [Gammaproteobacteria bacterium]|nr:MmgE/PrpD family protein [Gammaproteobacteria bacterium]